MSDFKEFEGEPKLPTESDPRYDDILQAVYEKARKSVAAGVEGWDVNQIDGSIELYSQHTGESGSETTTFTLRAVGELPASHDVVDFVFNNHLLRRSWDDGLEKSNDVSILDANTRVQYFAFAAPKPLSGRDYCIVTRREVREDGSIFQWSVSCDAKPVGNYYIRATMFYSAFLAKKLPSNKCRVVHSISTDLKGEYAASLKDMAAKRAMVPLSGILKLLSKVGPAFLPKVKEDIEKLKQQRATLPSPKPSTSTSTAKVEVKEEKKSLQEPLSPKETKEEKAPAAAAPAPAPGGGGSIRDQVVAQLGTPGSNKYETQILKTLDSFLDAIKGDGWEYQERQKEVDIFTKQDKTLPVPFMKGVGTLPIHADTIYFVWQKCREKWNDTFIKGRVVETVDKNTGVGYAAFSAPFPVSGRDFVSLAWKTRLDGGGWIVLNTSVEHPKIAPTCESFVRGTLYFSGLLLEPLSSNPNHTKVTYVVAQNPNGSIRPALVKKAAIKQPLSIAMVGEVISKNAGDYTEQAKAFLEQEEKKEAQPGAAAAPTEDNKDEEDFKGYETSRIIDWELEERGGDEAKEFNRISRFTHSRALIKALFKTLVAPFAKESTSTTYQAGVLCVRVVTVKGRGPMLAKRAAKSTIHLNVGDVNITTESTEKNKDLSFPVYDPSATLSIKVTADAEEGTEDNKEGDSKGKSTLGLRNIPIIDLWAPAAKKKGGGRRGWYKLGDRDVFICLETSYVFSKLADLTAEYYRKPSSVKSGSTTTYDGTTGVGVEVKNSDRYDAGVLVENAYRLIDAAEPFQRLYDSFYNLLKWNHPTNSGFFLLFLILCCYYPFLFVIGVSLFGILSVTTNAANLYFEKVLEDSPSWRQKQFARDDVIRQQVHNIRKREDRLPNEAKVQLQGIQEFANQSADFLENVLGKFDWSDSDATSMTLLFCFVCIFLSILLPWRIMTVFLAVSLIAWNSKPYQSFRWISARSMAYWSRRLKMASTIA